MILTISGTTQLRHNVHYDVTMIVRNLVEFAKVR